MNNLEQSGGHYTREPSFGSPEEELAYLREKVREKEASLAETEVVGGRPERPMNEMEQQQATSEVVHEYQDAPPEEARMAPHGMGEYEQKRMALELEPEEHDTIMDELLWTLENRGVMSALSVVKEIGSPHIEDDFHRLLVQYVKGTEVGRKRKDVRVFEALRMTLYEVTIPENYKKEDAAKGLKELLSNMEQFYMGMLSVKKNTSGFFSNTREYFSLEVAVSEDSDKIIFYAAVPDSSTDLFEYQVTSLFPSAQIEITRGDYNIFNHDGVSVGSYAKATESSLLPIRTYKSFEEDPINVILNAFSKITKEGEGAAIQFLIAPTSKRAYFEPYKKALDDIQNGRKKVKDAIRVPKTALGGTFRAVSDTLTEASDTRLARAYNSTQKPERSEERSEQLPADEEAVKGITEKIATPIFETNIRVVASARDEIRAERLLADIEGTFYQFGNTRGNGIAFHRVPLRRIPHFLHLFSFRLLSNKESLPLNTEELTTLLHFPDSTVSSHQLKQPHARSAPAPLGIENTEGILLGVNSFRGKAQEVHYAKEDRVRHFYAIGQTGTGKTTLLKNMIIQDIQNGDGVCYIDPHGNDIDDVLANIPKERIDDVIYFDPSHTEHPMGLNMLEFNPDHPEQKSFVVNEMLSIFEKIFSNTPEGLGPMFQQYFRNATQLVLEDPASGCTLFDVPRVLADEKYRNLKLSRSKNPVVNQFWTEIAGKAGGEASLQNIVPYITSKTDGFLANDIMRPIVAQEHSAFNFRQVMDEKKILLVNLSKGRLGDQNSHLIGLIIVGKILMAALSRVDSLSAGKPNDFYLYIDEFQNVTTDSISTILSEARKYRLSLNIAHQYIAQLDDHIRDSVFGNVGSMAAFRVGTEDAEFLEGQFEPVFGAGDLIRVENRNALVKMLVDGQPTKPFNLSTIAPEEGNKAIVEKLKELSHMKYGRPREEVEKEILKRYNK